MLVGLFAARTSWIGLLFVLLGLFLLWLFFRAMVDLVRWFREEIIEDFREQRSKKRRDPKGKP